jgi:hypothetical protein
MDCKKEVTSTFTEDGVIGTSTFTFYALTVTVEMTKGFKVPPETTSADLQLLPIRAAIKNLQTLLPESDQSAK